MIGYIKYFDDGGKNMSFVTDDEEVYKKYNKIWEVVRKLLKVKFTVNPIRDDNIINNIIPIERNNDLCIAAIDIDSVLKIDNKRAYPQAYLGQCKYKLRKRKIVNFIDSEIADEDSNDSYEEISIEER